MDLASKETLQQLKLQKQGCETALKGLKTLASEHKVLTHIPFRHNGFDVAIEIFEIELIGLNAQLRRIEVIGR